MRRKKYTMKMKYNDIYTIYTYKYTYIHYHVYTQKK